MFPPQLPSSNRPRNLSRLLFILVLAAGVALLLAHTQPAPRMARDRGWRAAAHLTLGADVLYRLSIFAEASGDSAQAKAMQQMAIALYERSALGPTPSAPAAYRLGIFYSKLGYPDHGRQFLEQAAQLDEDRHQLYLLLSAIYEEGAVDKVGWLEHASLLDDQPRWLAGLTRADMYQRLDEHDRSRQLRRQWQGQQFIFGLMVSGLLIVYGILGLLGLVMLAHAVVRLARQPTSRRPRHIYVPWQLIDIVEVVVVLVFLMVGLTLAAGKLHHYLPRPDSAGIIDAIIVAAVYLLSTAATLAVIYYRIGSYRRPWRMLGLRVDHLPTRIGWGLVGYGVFICLLASGLFAARGLDLVSSLPGLLGQLKEPLELISQPQTPAAYAVYFVLICLIAPLVEEIIFRGFIYAGLRRITGMTPALLLSAAIFASVHVAAPAGGMVVIGGLGLVMAYLYEHTRSLVPSIVTHSLHNTLLFILLAAYGLL